MIEQVLMMQMIAPLVAFAIFILAKLFGFFKW